jgi:hypothetical protein
MFAKSYPLTNVGEFDIMSARSRLVVTWVPFDQIKRPEFITLIGGEGQSSWTQATQELRPCPSKSF